MLITLNKVNIYNPNLNNFGIEPQQFFERIFGLFEN